MNNFGYLKSRISVKKQSFEVHRSPSYASLLILSFGKNIGIDRTTQKQTSIMTIITDKFNNLITTFPGKPGR